MLVNQQYHLCGSLKSIHTAILCRSGDIKYAGLDSVIGPFARDIKCLDEKGVHVGLLVTELFGTLCYILVDNLGTHFIGQFYENFSTVQYFCRFCNLTLNEFNSAGSPTQLSFDIRDKNLYEFQNAKKKENPDFSKLCGLKTECIFDKHLQHFHASYRWKTLFHMKLLCV